MSIMDGQLIPTMKALESSLVALSKKNMLMVTATHMNQPGIYQDTHPQLK